MTTTPMDGGQALIRALENEGVDRTESDAGGASVAAVIINHEDLVRPSSHDYRWGGSLQWVDDPPLCFHWNS